MRRGKESLAFFGLDPGSMSPPPGSFSIFPPTTIFSYDARVQPFDLCCCRALLFVITDSFFSHSDPKLGSAVEQHRHVLLRKGRHGETYRSTQLLVEWAQYSTCGTCWTSRRRFGNSLLSAFLRVLLLFFLNWCALGRAQQYHGVSAVPAVWVP